MDRYAFLVTDDSIMTVMSTCGLSREQAQTNLHLNSDHRVIHDPFVIANYIQSKQQAYNEIPDNPYTTRLKNDFELLKGGIFYEH